MRYRDTRATRHELTVIEGLVVLRLFHDGGTTAYPLDLAAAEHLGSALVQAAKDFGPGPNDEGDD